VLGSGHPPGSVVVSGEDGFGPAEGDVADLGRGVADDGAFTDAA